jgi:hypothetical protein
MERKAASVPRVESAAFFVLLLLFFTLFFPGDAQNNNKQNIVWFGSVPQAGRKRKTGRE